MVTVRRKTGSESWTGAGAEDYRRTRREVEEANKAEATESTGYQTVNVVEKPRSRKSKNHADSNRRRDHRAGTTRIGAGTPHRSAVRTKYREAPPKAFTGTPLVHPLLPDLDPTDIKVSIVLGTYNRLKLLKDCVESIRKAARHLRYEIVVCDGGSTDGSVGWLQAQDDVVYLEGDLSGAVKAFNAAARKARGEFILALNDDAQLDPKAIIKGLKYFDDPLVGQVAFSFLEHGVWKIEPVLDHIYANFALTRTNIVRAVEKISGGMWATCYRTYGGDTEFSCWVYRLGYQVVGAQDAKVIHKEHVDGLRQKNTKIDRQRYQFQVRWAHSEYLKFRGPTPKVRAHEIQSLAHIERGESLQDRWPRIAETDPKRGESPLRSPLKGERVLHWQLHTADDPQTSMVDALRKLGSAGHSCVRWPDFAAHNRGQVFVETVKSIRPTLIFLQCQNPDAIPVAALKAVRDDPNRDPSLVVCVWSGDIGPTKGPWSGSKDEWQYRIASAVDLMLFTGMGQVDHHRARGMVNAAYLQIGYDEDRYFPGPSEGYGTKHTVTFVGQNYGPQFNVVPGSEAQLRRDAVKALRSIEGFVPYGSGFGAGIPQAQSGELYRASSMAMSISLTSNLARYSSDRLLRSMACGCPTLVKRFDDMEGMGLLNGSNCLAWDSPDELVNLARIWLDPARHSELLQLGQAGADLMKTHHTWGVRMEELQAITNVVRKQK